LTTIILLKIESIERCVNRIKKLYTEGSLDDYLYQDAIVLNLQKACQQAIDLSMYLCSEMHFGIPKKSRQAFEMLYKNHVIDEVIYKKMAGIVGFRNVAVHEYQHLNIDILKNIIETELDDFFAFTKQIIAFLRKTEKSQ